MIEVFTNNQKISMNWGPLVRKSTPKLASKAPAGIIADVLPIIYMASGVAFVAILVWGGFEYLTSGGDPKKIAQARGKLTAGIVGLLIVVTSYWGVQIIARMLNIRPILDIFG